MHMGDGEITVWIAMPLHSYKSISLDKSFVFPDIPSCGEKKKEEQNIQLPHIS